MSLIKLFNEVKKASYDLNKNNKNPDGHKFWQPIKKILENINNLKVKYKCVVY